MTLGRSAFVRRASVLVVLCVGAMTYAYDWDRIIFLAAPVIYVAAGIALTGRRRLAIAVVGLLLAVDVGYGAYLQHHGIAGSGDGAPSGVPVR